MRTLPVKKIMRIIEEQKHITVKLSNKPLLRRLEAMSKDGLIECKDSFKDCIYYGLPGVPWSLGGAEEADHHE